MIKFIKWPLIIFGILIWYSIIVLGLLPLIDELSNSESSLVQQFTTESSLLEDALIEFDDNAGVWGSQAKSSAESYLSFSAFSKTGLIKQLEFEGFSNSEATEAVAALSVDWNEQALKSAKSYLSFSSFSKSGLVKQLMFEGFTESQANYAVNAID